MYLVNFIDVDGGSDVLVPANCQASDGVNALVYITGPAVAGRFQVAKANIKDTTKMPAVGIIVSKSDSTTCVVQLFGAVTSAAGLTPQAMYFVGASGFLTKTRPVANGGYAMVQIVGVAHSDNILFLSPSNNMTKVVP